MAKAFFRQNPTSKLWEYGSFLTDGITPAVEYTIPAGLYRARWETVDTVVQITLVNANNVGELSPIRNLPIGELASDLIGTPYANRAAFETAAKDFFFRVGATGLIPNAEIPGYFIRMVSRTGYTLAFDRQLTATGFAGTEGVDWDNLGGFGTL